mmetsp:Transcript_39399/g.34866  ORF Transcript_39399/g.34866 Transcript_39399/m.34866 type:complete len:154 (-) Transcript_39399:128-589(-)
MEAKFELKNQACVMVCCFGLVIAVDIAALVISQQDHSECDGEGSVMAMDTFAIVAGAIGISLGLISMILALCVCKVEDPSDTENIKKQGGWAFLTSLVFLVISIIGFVNYSDASDSCKQTPLGEVILAWCIIRIIGACCGCCQGGVAMKGGGM